MDWDSGVPDSLGVEGPVGYQFYDHTMTGLSARTFREGWSGLVVDSLTSQRHFRGIYVFFSWLAACTDESKAKLGDV